MTTAPKLPSIVSDVFEMLNTKHYAYAVLRNFEGLPYTNKSRDIDILVKGNEYKSLKKDMTDCFIQNSYQIINYFESERLKTFICGKIERDKIELVQFDFFVHTSAYGHIILTADEMLESRTCTNGIYHVSKEYEFLDKYLYLKYIGAKYPAKYSVLKEQMLQNMCVTKILKKLYGVESLQQLDALSTRDFRHRVRKTGKERVNNIWLFWKHYIVNLLFYKGFSIGFTGPDGVGKTTIINLLQTHLSAVYSKINLYHFRPTVFGNLGDVAHSVGLKKEVDHEYNKPHRGKKVGWISSFIRLLYYAIDYIIGYFKRIRPLLVKRELVIFDRYYIDIICDSQRSRIHLSKRILYLFYRLCIPTLNYNILLTANTNTILSRKQELDSKSIQAINEKIDYLCSQKGFYKVLNEGTSQETVAEILRIVFDEQHKKNLKRLCRN